MSLNSKERTYSKNLELIIPQANDVVERQDFVTNWEKIDTHLLTHADHFILGNNDWTGLIYEQKQNNTGSISYVQDKGVVVKGSVWLTLRMRLPIDEESTYFAKVKVKKDQTPTTDNALFYAGAKSLNNNFENISSDGQTQYNYFLASMEKLEQDQAYTFEGEISGYNPKKSDENDNGSRNKFDPGANYFDMVIICNYNTQADTSEHATIIQSLEVYKAPKKMIVTGETKIEGSENSKLVIAKDKLTYNGAKVLTADDYITPDAKNISIEDTNNNFNADNVEGALSELFQDVSDGKSKIATAITDVDGSKDSKGSDTFDELAQDIKNIKINKSFTGHELPANSYHPTHRYWNIGGHGTSSNCITVDNAGNVYTGSSSGEVRKFNSSGNVVWSYQSGYIITDIVELLGNVYCSMYHFFNGYVGIHKLNKNGIKVWDYQGHGAVVYGLAISPTGYLYSGGEENKIHRINTNNGVKLWEYTGHSDDISAIAVEGDNYIYSASWDNTLHKIRVSDRKRMWNFTQHTDDVNTITIDKDGYIYSGGSDNKVYKINPSNGAKLKTYTFAGAGVIYDIAVDQSGYLYTCGEDHILRKTRISDGALMWKYEGHSKKINQIAVDTSEYVYSISEDQRMHKISGKYRLEL
ncbi:outer membrane protein assembly factor BamB family protein [Longirhabdus pacifica]|uniref:outer membrane protein assembly factor BamB family protein n=1 Tax=Longirhabdus pacifica TaxID=2305227 RepID=UPI00100878B9|nr:PQQ-binding-like beta-propeller repeat protein [Longirhabdus pacifica]